MKKLFCITIPVYTEKLSPIDVIGLERLFEVVEEKNYDVYLVCPKGLNIDEYLKIYPTLIKSEFDKSFFINIHAYSQLCINYEFYNRFSDYEYMFLYQLDAYIFRDEIGEWCKKGYDYIGGPIFTEISGWDLHDSNGTYINAIGNGGCSWRKIKTFKDITDPNGEFRTYYNLTDDVLDFVDIEDEYFGSTIRNYYNLNVPNWEIAGRAVLDGINEDIFNKYFLHNFPMAAHGVSHYIKIWNKYIPELNDPEFIKFNTEREKNGGNTFVMFKDQNGKIIPQQRIIFNKRINKEI